MSEFASLPIRPMCDSVRPSSKQGGKGAACLGEQSACIDEALHRQQDSGTVNTSGAQAVRAEQDGASSPPKAAPLSPSTRHGIAKPALVSPPKQRSSAKGQAGTSLKSSVWSVASLSTSKPFLPSQMLSSGHAEPLPPPLATNKDEARCDTLDDFRKEHAEREHPFRLVPTLLDLPAHPAGNAYADQGWLQHGRSPCTMQSALPPRLQSLAKRSTDGPYYSSFEQDCKTAKSIVDHSAWTGATDLYSLHSTAGLPHHLNNPLHRYSSPTTGLHANVAVNSSNSDNGIGDLCSDRTVNLSGISSSYSPSLSAPSLAARGPSSEPAGTPVRSKSSSSTWITSCPSTSLASAVQLANLGVGIGPGVNPNVSSSGSPSMLGCITPTQNNPPIVNTGNNGPMCVQPGDWVCSSCGFVNWRRRRVCMRCFPFADTNEMSQSIASGALLAAQLAAGIEPSPEAMTSLTQPRRTTTETAGHSMASQPGTSYAHSGPSDARSRVVNSSMPFPVNARSTPDLLQRRMQTSEKRALGEQDEWEKLISKTLSLRAGLSLSGTGISRSSAQQAGTHPSSPFPPPTPSSHISRSPSMPALPSSGTTMTPGRSIWTSVGPSAINTTQSSNGASLSLCTSLYRPYEPPTDQSLLGVTASKCSPDQDVWPSPIGCRPNKNSSLSALRSSPGEQYFEGQWWMASNSGIHTTHTPSTQFSGSSSSTVRPSRPGSGSVAISDDNDEFVTDGHHKKASTMAVDEGLGNDSSAVTPLLSKSQAIIQPPLLSQSDARSPVDCISSLPSILLSVTASPIESNEDLVKLPSRGV